MEQSEVFKDIPFEIDAERLIKKLHIRQGRMEDDFRALCAEAAEHARPKAMVRVAYVDEKGEDYVVIEGVKLVSRVLRINLDQAERVFLVCATCGVELFEWGNEQHNSLSKFWATAVQEQAMFKATDSIRSYIEKNFNPGKLGVQNPGSLKDWPIDEQQKLFQLIGDAESTIGVTLSAGNMMIPSYSVSGIVFPTEVSFINCMLCQRKKCPQRRAAYDEKLYRNRYGLK